MSILPIKRTIIYLRHQGIEVYYGGGKLKRIPISTVAMVDQDILDYKAFEKEVLEGFQKFRKGKASIVLSDEILYYVKVADLQKFDPRELFDLTPFDKGNIALKILAQDKEHLAVAANRTYIEYIRFILEKRGWKITSVVPLLISVLNGNTADYNALKKVTGNSSYIEHSNFLKLGKFDKLFLPRQETPKEAQKKEDDEDEEKISRKQYILLALSFVFLAGAIGFGVYQMRPSETPVPAKVEIKSVISVTPTKAATESAALSRDEIKVEILNGTGVAGQAGIVKAALDEAGYINSVTDNAQGTASENTTVNFSVKVSDDYQKEIVEILKESFVNVVSLTNQNTSEFDVIITTGEAL